jgi:ABC-type branched-subunit amino acid transport system substrate-binding protein
LKKFRRNIGYLVVVAAAAFGVAACGSSSKSSSTSGGSGSSGSATSASATSSGSSGGASKGSINVAVISDLTGALASTGDPQGALAYFKALNKAGGVDGYKVNVQEYDAQSSPGGAVQAFRKAVASKPVAIVAATVGATSALPSTAKSGIPTVGDGFVPGWTNEPTLFSPVGDVSAHLSNVWLQVLKSHGAQNVALLTSPLEKGDQELMAQQAPKLGMKVALSNTGLPESLSSAEALSVAQQIKSSGATGVLIFGLQGGTEVQADLNQLQVKATVLETSEFGPGVVKQFGSRVNGMLFAGVFTTAYTQHNVGITDYKSAMSAAGYGSDTLTLPYATLRYAQAKFLVEQGLKPVGPPFANAKVVAALASTKNYTGGGLLPNTTFPKYQHVGSSCLNVAEIVNGQWVSKYNGSFPFTCGGPSLPTPS